jgi:hypothetical protein
MKAKILVVNLPFGDSVVDALNDIIDDIEDAREERCGCEEEFIPREPTRKPWDCSCTRQLQPWGIAGKPADKNLRFGADFRIDEPRSSDFSSRAEFIDAHDAFDKFVTAGEDCVARGMAAPEGVTLHKCNAIRKRLEDGPVFGRDLIGETDWWG